MFSVIYYSYMLLCFIGAVNSLSSICKGKSKTVVYVKGPVVAGHIILLTVVIVSASALLSGWLLIAFSVGYSFYSYLLSCRKLAIGYTTILVVDQIRMFFKIIIQVAVISFIYYGSLNQWFSTISASSLYHWASALPISG